MSTQIQHYWLVEELPARPVQDMRDGAEVAPVCTERYNTARDAYAHIQSVVREWRIMLVRQAPGAYERACFCTSWSGFYPVSQFESGCAIPDRQWREAVRELQ